MRFFLDTEFIEDGRTIDLISVGIVAEDSREFYAQNSDCDLDRASDWVRENVLPHLTRSNWYERNTIRDSIVKFVGDQPEFWGYYADYDWVVLCQLFGRMIDLPGNWPKFCMDLKQLAVMRGIEKLPKQTSTEHHALADARWVRDMWRLLQ